MGNVYLYLCIGRNEVRVAMCIVVFVVCAVCGMMKGGEKVKSSAGT